MSTNKSPKKDIERQEPDTIAGPGGAVSEIGGSASGAAAAGKEIRDMARQWDQEDKLAKKSRSIGGKAVHVGATSVQIQRTSEGKYGLRRPASTANNCNEETETPVAPTKRSLNFYKVQIDTPGPDSAARRSDRDISVAQRPEAVEDDVQENYMVQATLVSESTLRPENELDIPQAEIVDLERLQPETKLICIPESNRGRKICLGTLLFLATAVVVIVALVVTSKDDSVSPDTPRPTISSSALQPTETPYPTPTNSPTNLQPTQSPVPITSVEWFGNQYNISNTTEIDLLDNKLKGTMPTEIGVLTALTKLRVDGNNLSGTIPNELGHLSNLIYLRLDGNDFVGTVPTQLGLLSALTKLTLGGNEITGTIPTELGSLLALEGIWSAENQLSGPIPSELGLLTALTSFIFRSNRLTGSLPSELGLFTALKTMWLYNNEFEGSIPSQVCEITNLTDLVRDCVPDDFPLNCTCGERCKCF